MASRTGAPSAGRSEKIAVVASRRGLLFGVAVALGVVAVGVTWFAPGVLPSTAVFGAAVGVAALLIGLAATLAADTADLVVRGPRHVHAAGADVAAVIGRDPNDVAALLSVVAGTSRGGRVRVGVVAASRAAGAPAARATALGRALAQTGKRVLLTDMTRGTSSASGLSEVIAGSHKLRDVVRFETGVYLGHVAIGTDPVVAMDGYANWVERLPSDLEVLVAAFPPISDPGALAAVRSLDVVLLQVEVDRTERVDLLASLDALDHAGVQAEVVLIDPMVGRPVPDETTNRVEDPSEGEADTAADPAAAAGPEVVDGEDESGDDEFPPFAGVTVDPPSSSAPDGEQAGVEGEIAALIAARSREAAATSSDDALEVPGILEETTDRSTETAVASTDAADDGEGDEEDDADDTVDDPGLGGQSGVPPLAEAGSTMEIAPVVAHDPVEGSAPVRRPPAGTAFTAPEPVATPDPDPTPDPAPAADREPTADRTSPEGGPTPSRDSRWLDPRAVWSDLPTGSRSAAGGSSAPESPRGPSAAGSAAAARPEAATDRAPATTEPAQDEAAAVSPPPLERDALTEEAVRATAALQALAFKVWERDEGQ